jgi:hypothetical protein
MKGLDRKDENLGAKGVKIIFKDERFESRLRR